MAYIDRETCKHELLWQLERRWGAEREETARLIDEIPAADVAPVVRCIDCDKASSKDHCGAVWCRLHKRPMSEQDFCSYGAKMDESERWEKIKVSIRPDGVHELDPHLYKLKEKHRNVTIEVLEDKDGHTSIGWYRQENTEDQ